MSLHVRSEKIKSLINQLFPEERQPEGLCRRSPRRTVTRDASVESPEPSSLLSSTSTISSSTQDLQHSPISSSTQDLQHSPIRSSTQDLQHSQDPAASAISGDDDNDEQASFPGGADMLDPQLPCPDSGTEHTDEGIPADLMIKNLDTGEEIPLIQAVADLPSGIYPLTQHIMTRTQEYGTYDADQSDDDDRATDTDTEDGGKVKQKTIKLKERTIQLKNIVAKYVKETKHLAEKFGEMAVNKVKNVHDDAAQSTQLQQQQQSDDGDKAEGLVTYIEQQQSDDGDNAESLVIDIEQQQQQQSDDDDKEVDPVTDADEGIPEQKLQLEFLGMSVEVDEHLLKDYGMEVDDVDYGERAIDDVKSVHDDAAQSGDGMAVTPVTDIEERKLKQKTRREELKKFMGSSVKGARHFVKKYKRKSVRDDDGVQSTQRQSDDGDKAEAPVTDVDRSKLQQKTDQLKKFMGRSVQGARRLAGKYVNVVKSVHQDAAQSAQQQQSDDDKVEASVTNTDGGTLRQKADELRKLVGRSVRVAKLRADAYRDKAISKIKSVYADQDDEGKPYTGPAKFKAAHSFEGPFNFDQIKLVQDLSGEHTGPVWTMKFSHCGRLLATAGQDKVVRVWVLKDAYDFFDHMRNNPEGCAPSSPSQRSVCSSDTDDGNAPFCQVPFCEYKGHKSELLDLCWSKDYLLLSSSMDKTVRLWHISRRDCLYWFPHKDFVTAITFHPRKQLFFLSGSLDGKLRLWSIIDKKVVLWNEVEGPKLQLITAASFCETGKYAIIGTYDGRCVLYDTEHLKYHTQILVRSSKGRNTVGHKITGIEPLPGENKILVTSNDSRIRLYDLADMSLVMKYKGYTNSRSQIKASFSHDYSFIVSGSEDKYVYIWSTYYDSRKFPSVRRDRNDFWEGIKAHNALVTSAIFAPHPGLIVPQETRAEKSEAECKSMGSEDSETVPSGTLKTDHSDSEVLVSADFTGAIKVYINVKGREVALKTDTGLQVHRVRGEDSSPSSVSSVGTER